MTFIISLIMQLSVFTGINFEDFQSMTQQQQLEYVRDIDQVSID